MNLAEMVIAKLGINPEQLKTALEGVVRDAAVVRNEVLAAKAGFVQAVGHFKTQLNRIEDNQREIMARLAIPLDVAPPQIEGPKPNGKDRHVPTGERTDDGHERAGPQG